MAFWRISILSLLLIALPHPVTVSAEDAPMVAVPGAGNPLLGTWRSSDTGWTTGPATTTFLTVRADGTYQVRVHESRLPGVNGVLVIMGAYDMAAPGRIVFQPRESFTCPAASSCVPYALGTDAYAPQTVTFRPGGSRRMTDQDGLLWHRVR